MIMGFLLKKSHDFKSTFPITRENSVFNFMCTCFLMGLCGVGAGI